MNNFSPKNRNPKRQNPIDGFLPRTGSIGTFDSSKNRSSGSNPTRDDIQSLDKPTHPDGVFKNSRSLESALQSHGNIVASPMYQQGVKGRKLDKNSKKRSKSRNAFKALFMMSSFVFVAALLLGGFIFGKAWLGAHKVFQGGGSSSILFSKEVTPAQLNGEGDGRVNILLAGIGGGDHPGADLTDSLMVASIDPVAKEVTLLSIPRDLWVKVPDFYTMKINAAYSNAKDLAIENGSTQASAQEAGFKSLEKTVEETLGITIHYHALVNFQAFKDGVNAVGGINLNVKEDLYDPMIAWEINKDPYDYLIAAKGPQTFDGMHALTYARSRYTSSDFARGERQREVLIALKEKSLTAGTFTNPQTISKLIDALGNNVSVNAKLNEMMRMYEITKVIPPESIASLSFAEEPNLLVSTANINDQSVVVPRLGVGDYSEIQSFVRNAIRDPYLKLENATITVLNGTSVTGLATTKSTELKSYGYNVTNVDTAPTSTYTKTVIYMKADSTAKFTKNYLEKRLGVTVSTPPTDSTIPMTTDFVIVVGTNENSNSSN